MGQYADELQNLYDTYIVPQPWKGMFLQMSSNGAYERLAQEKYALCPDPVLRDTELQAEEVIYFRYLAYATSTREEFYRAWCDEYYAISGDPSLRTD